MSLTQGDPLPNIRTTKTVDTTGPDWYTEYLENLAKPGAALIGQSGADLVAPMSEMQTGVLGRAEEELGGYTGTLGDAAQTAELAAAGITPEMIQSFMNPYTTGFTNAQGVRVPGVIDEMERLQQQNLQRNLLPSLKGAFGATGATGSQRMLGAMGQMGADVQANLLGQQTKALESGYNAALKAAAEQAGLYRSAAETQRGIGVSELDTKLRELERLYNLGGEEQKLEQAKIMAPLTAAKSAADVYSNLKVPSTVSEEAYAPIPGAYSTSPLAQIAGLGSLFASGAGGTSAVEGVLSNLPKFGTALGGLFSGLGAGGGGSSIDASGDGFSTETEYSPY